MISINEARPLLKNLTARRIRFLCASGRIDGAKLVGGTWVLPINPIISKIVRAKK